MVCAEIELAVNVAPRNLVLTIALVKDASLQGVIVPRPGEVVVHVNRGVGLVPRSGSQVRILEINVIEIPETEIRDGLVLG